MAITASTISLNVADPQTSARFLSDTLGFTEQMSADGFIALAHPEAGMSVVYLAVGLKSFKPKDKAGAAGEGLLVAFTVDDIDAEYERLTAAGVPIVTPIETEPWGERYFQMIDPNGIIIQLVQWV
ncbi:VOC family protein [Nocardia goodfellowii]|uniref:Glyoxalase superfamily protein PhnB n=1 Tax=Nocardia goodfellowii TaxID=882446 RepID=A0ABS4QC37_9NOCA|nr:VOC family protein [Nocardia goodfellowii]MBP2188679.1 putative glyoxalase superfamily protein PhnB [Nocardia goodfellowii]